MINAHTFHQACADSSTLGGKAKSLVKLTQLSIPVPKGFVLACKEDPKNNRGYLLEALNNYQLNSELVIVRSSGVGEDGDETSFAGQLDSFVVKNNLTDISEAVFKCWQSLRNQRLAVYSASKQFQIKQMGIVVQEFVEPDYSGVYFTAAPDNASLSLVEYVPGRCEKLVQGEVTPKSVYSNQDHQFPYPHDELVDLAHKIRDEFGVEQDIEWVAKDQQVYIVQARPITEMKYRLQWSSTNVNENYPDKLSPMLYSIARKSYYHYFKNLAVRLKLIKPGEAEEYFSNIIGLWGERMYYNMSHIHSVLALTPFAKLFMKSFDHFVGYQKGESVQASVKGLWVKLNFGLRVLYNFITLEKHVQQIEKRVGEYTKKMIKPESTGKLFHEFLFLRFHFWYHASFADFFAMVFHGLLGKTIQKLGYESGVQNSLVQSIPNLISHRPIQEIWKLRQMVERQGLKKEFLSLSAGELYLKIQEDPCYEEFQLQMNDYLNHWGFRCSGELTFLSQNYIEHPESFISMFQTYLKTEQVNPLVQFKSQHKEQTKLLRKIKRELRAQFGFILGQLKYGQLQWIINATTKSIAARERVRLKQAHMYFQFKSVCLEVGSALQQAKILKEPEDIFFFEYDEVSRLLNHEEVDGHYLRSLVSLRKDRSHRAKEHPENFYSFQAGWSNHHIDLDEAEGDLKGLPACGGKVQARAIVLESVHQIDQLQKGDILITKQTDPGWICAFPLISGLIVERGGMLSHGAIVAREFGIPAVVGIKGVTQKIKSGSIVELDGDRGQVYVKDN